MSVFRNKKYMYIDYVTYAPIHSNRYAPHHDLIQKKKERFHQDCFYLANSYDTFPKTIGINKEDLKIDDRLWFDAFKDGN